MQAASTQNQVQLADIITNNRPIAPDTGSNKPRPEQFSEALSKVQKPEKHEQVPDKKPETPKAEQKPEAKAKPAEQPENGHSSEHEPETGTETAVETPTENMEASQPEEMASLPDTNSLPEEIRAILATLTIQFPQWLSLIESALANGGENFTLPEGMDEQAGALLTRLQELIAQMQTGQAKNGPFIPLQAIPQEVRDGLVKFEALLEKVADLPPGVQAKLQPLLTRMQEVIRIVPQLTPPTLIPDAVLPKPLPVENAMQKLQASPANEQAKILPFAAKPESEKTVSPNSDNALANPVAQQKAAPIAFAQTEKQPMQTAEQQTSQPKPSVVNPSAVIQTTTEEDTGSGQGHGSQSRSSAEQPQIFSFARDTFASDQVKQADQPTFRQTMENMRGSVAEQVEFQMKTALKNGETRVHIQLHPVELGQVDVELHAGADGKTTLRFTADNVRALEALQREIKMLERALQDVGMKPETGGLSFNLRGEQQQPHQQGSRRQAYKNIESINETDALEQALLTAPMQSYNLNISDSIDIVT